jgi:periplasmic protein TonB
MSSPNAPIPPSQQPPAELKHAILPTLFGDGYGLYEVRKGSFVVSYLLICTVVGLVFWAGTWTVNHVPEVQKAVGLSLDISPYVLPQSTKDRSGGGGGGGSHDPKPASKGALPKFAKTQIAPPTVLPMEQPKLPVMPTVVVPPEIKLPQTTGQMGDPMSKVIGPLSNGPGLGGGIGSGSGGGVGSGSGPGVGPGHGGGIGGGAYRPGNGVLAPKLIYKLDPEFSEEARKNKYQGVVVLYAVVGTDGKPRDITVKRSLGMGLDEKAKEALLQWRFEPGTKDGQPVPVEVYVEVSFHLF